ncbi:MAG: aminotransferase class IV, partial [Pseudomonadales bacterium]|nr:aminotransferase class IV [Pseudomonadales bacterium]
VIQNSDAQNGIKVITVPETRWAHRDVKTAALLPASLAKQTAKQAGAQDAWFVEDGRVTEGSSNNAFIVTEQREIITRDLGQHVLPGITRAAVIRLAEEQGYQVIERGFTVIEAESATEAFFTSATAFAIPVVEINGHKLSSGKPGPVFQAIRAAYLDHVRSQIP